MKITFPKVTRRGFLQVAAGTGAGATLGGLTVKAVSSGVAAMSAEVRPDDGPESWVATTCLGCSGACGLLVRKIGDRAVYVKGNPKHPVTRGGVCPRALAALQWTYHPDRLQSPMRKSGGKGSARWEKITWDAALQEIAQRWAPLLKDKEAGSLVLLSGRRAGLLFELMQSFAQAFANGHLVVMPSGLDAITEAVARMQGLRGPWSVELESARYVLSFGCNLLEGWGSPVESMRAFATWRDSSRGFRSKFVQISPRMSVTAAKADEWVSVRPGTEGILALGIAHAQVAEGIYDREFVAQNTVGFEDWTDQTGKTHEGFRTQILRDYRLSDVAARTDVPAETILRIARESAANAPALAFGDISSSFQPGTLFGSMAVHSLNLLSGAAGTLVHEAPTPIAPNGRHGRQPAGRDGMAQMWSALQRGEPYRIASLFLSEANPIMQLPGGDAWREALQKVPFVVVSATFLDETAAQADLILPAPTFLETWDDAPSPAPSNTAVQGLVTPVIQGAPGAKHPGDVLLAVAGKLAIAELSAVSNFQSLIKDSVASLFKQQRGYVFSSPIESTWDLLLQKTGWWSPSYSTADELWEQMVQSGGWWDPGSRNAASTYAGEKFSFLPPDASDWPSQLSRQIPSDRIGIKLALPLKLEPFEVLPLRGGLGAEAPFLAQTLGQHLGEGWRTWAEMHSQTAEKFGLREDQWVWIESARGRIRARLRLRDDMHPDAVAVPLGLGRTDGARWASHQGAAPNDLLDPAFDKSTGLPLWWGTNVRVYPA